jgi:hypothetical protein
MTVSKELRDEYLKKFFGEKLAKEIIQCETEEKTYGSDVCQQPPVKLPRGNLKVIKGGKDG